MEIGKGRRSSGIFIQPITLLIIIIAAIFTSSAFVDLLLSILSPQSVDIAFSLLDAGLMLVILFPVIYYLVYEPLASSIKELNKSEEALQESEEKFRSLVETTNDSVYLVNRNCEYLFMNAQHRSRLGFLFDHEYMGRAFSDFHSPEETEVFCGAAQEVFKTGESLQHEHRSQRDGKYFLRTFSPIKGPSRTVTAVSVVSKDVTKLKNESEAELRYRAIFEQSPYGILIMDTMGKIIEFNETARRELGYSREEFGRLRLSDINPMSAQEIQDRISKVLQKGSHEFEVKHKTKDGEMRDVHVIARVLRLFGYTVIQAIWQDITERKRTEKELQLHGQILANMAEGVLLIRAIDGVIVYTNPKLERMFGYGPDELVGEHVSILNAPADISPKDRAREIITALGRDGVWTGEILNVRKDGAPFWCHAVVSTFEHPVHGSVWVAIHQGIIK